jgi:GntR family transcriptional regulator
MALDQIDPKLFNIDGRSFIPLYHQIKQNLRELIENKNIAGGQLLPSERELANYYGVNRLTLRQAVTDLVREGALKRQRGIGTFVAEPKLTQSIGWMVGFSDRIREAGGIPSSRVILIEVQPAINSVAYRLKAKSASQVVKLVRLRLADGEPVMLETSYLLKDRFVGIEAMDFSQNSLYKVMAEKYGVVITEVDEALEPVIMTPYELEQLQAQPGTPGMLVEATAYNQQESPIEFSKSIVRGDKARFFFHIKRNI